MPSSGRSGDVAAPARSDGTPTRDGGTDVEALIAELRALDDGDVWMLGGGKLQMAFIERGALDELEVYVISQLLGGGYPLFPPTGFSTSLKLLSAHALGSGGRPAALFV